MHLQALTFLIHAHSHALTISTHTHTHTHRPLQTRARARAHANPHALRPVHPLGTSIPIGAVDLRLEVGAAHERSQAAWE